MWKWWKNGSVFENGECRMMNKKRGHEEGFTLLETLVAISIIAIVIVGIYQLHAQTIDMTIDAQFYAISPLLAQQKLAEIELSPEENLSERSGDFGDDFPGYTWKTSVSDVESEFLGTVAESLKRLDISISLDDSGKTYDLRTYLFVQS
jgi:general secretion pathway protein I